MKTDNEKYNETVRPNTAFLDELKEKLPEFFTKEGSFDLDRLLCQESGHKSTNKFDFQFKLLNLIFGGRSFSPVQILKTL